jgi:hypothetical protein
MSDFSTLLDAAEALETVVDAMDNADNNLIKAAGTHPNVGAKWELLKVELYKFKRVADILGPRADR